MTSRRSRSRRVLVACCMALWIASVPAAVADHPGSVHGLAGYGDPVLAEQTIHHYDDIEAAFADWDSLWPERVDTQVIGSSMLGLPLSTIRITDEAIPFDGAELPTGEKLRVYLDGGHHGNEYLGVELIMYYLADLLALAADGDEETLSFLATHELWATPLVNPEGNLFDTRKNGNQVDMNRNYDFNWATEGSSDLLAGPTYHGPNPMSEPEVIANAAFAASIRPDVWVTTHTGVAEFYWPWGSMFDRAPDADLFESLEAPFENATNGAVDAMQSAELYLAGGATDDYGYAVVGSPTFTYEVHDDQFIPVYGESIPAVIADQLAGLDWIVKHTVHVGAWVDPHMNGGEFHVFNGGWGTARNVTVSWDGGAEVIAEIPAGEMYVFERPPAAQVAIDYPVLAIDSTKNRTVLFETGLLGDGSQEQDAPGFATVGLLAVLGAVAAIARRRRGVA